MGEFLRRQIFYHYCIVVLVPTAMEYSHGFGKCLGAPPLIYPEEAGYPIGGSEFSPYIRIEMHYNNPKSTAGRIDSSGIRFYYTTELRRYDAGCLELGLEYTPKMAIPPAMEAFQLSGHCIASCTQIVCSPARRKKNSKNTRTDLRTHQF